MGCHAWWVVFWDCRRLGDLRRGWKGKEREGKERKAKWARYHIQLTNSRGVTYWEGKERGKWLGNRNVIVGGEGGTILRTKISSSSI